MSSARLIKKYPNRRLYDTESSSYVTLDDLRQLIVEGEMLLVRDAKTGTDLTRPMLLQIITENEEAGPPLLSVEFLNHLIRHYGTPQQNSLSSYLRQCLDTFLSRRVQPAANALSLPEPSEKPVTP